jgi:hypothetical protein
MRLERAFGKWLATFLRRGNETSSLWERERKRERKETYVETKRYEGASRTLCLEVLKVPVQRFCKVCLKEKPTERTSVLTKSGMTKFMKRHSVVS